jgi:SagB-type dehydrogenase family enzyme
MIRARKPARPKHGESTTYVTSPFAWIRWSGGAGQVLAPLHGKAIDFVEPSVVSILHMFARPRALDGLDAESAEVARALIEAGAIQAAGDKPAGDKLDAKGVEKGLWEPHDSLFHVLSRVGRGGSFRFLDVLQPSPLFKPSMTRRQIDLPQALASKADSSVVFALARRRSVRRYGNVPLSLNELGMLLQIVARNRVLKLGQHQVEEGSRAYPSAGALYPLEIYPYVPRQGCVELEPGLYHYRPDRHSLEPLAHGGALRKRLSGEARRSAGIRGRAWILLNVTARIDRTAWKYEGIAYSLILKELGCLFQTLYLASEAIGLAGCAVGGGPLHELSRAAGLDPWEEPHVGEFFIGRPSSVRT